ncbi:MAG: fibronectin type III domain-containing protein, partial [Bacillota bacterium]|nr:fibronectin type III domain-containing protein [Bacillota bacterium]
EGIKDGDTYDLEKFEELLENLEDNLYESTYVCSLIKSYRENLSGNDAMAFKRIVDDIKVKYDLYAEQDADRAIDHFLYEVESLKEGDEYSLEEFRSLLDRLEAMLIYEGYPKTEELTKSYLKDLSGNDAMAFKKIAESIQTELYTEKQCRYCTQDLNYITEKIDSSGEEYTYRLGEFKEDLEQVQCNLLNRGFIYTGALVSTYIDSVEDNDPLELKRIINSIKESVETDIAFCYCDDAIAYWLAKCEDGDDTYDIDQFKMFLMGLELALVNQDSDPFEHTIELVRSSRESVSEKDNKAFVQMLNDIEESYRAEGTWLSTFVVEMEMTFYATKKGDTYDLEKFKKTLRTLYKSIPDGEYDGTRELVWYYLNNLSGNDAFEFKKASNAIRIKCVQEDRESWNAGKYQFYQEPLDAIDNLIAEYSDMEVDEDNVEAFKKSLRELDRVIDEIGYLNETQRFVRSQCRRLWNNQIESFDNILTSIKKKADTEIAEDNGEFWAGEGADEFFEGDIKSVTVETDSVTYDGEEQRPVLRVSNSAGGDLLEEYYKATYENNVNVGTATVKVVGLDRFKGTAETTFQINPAAISSIAMEREEVAYTGKEQKSKVTAYDAKGNVIPADSYDVSYKDNVNVGTATATVVAKGNYTGTIEKNFKIEPIEITKIEVGNVTYNGKEQKPKVTVYDAKGNVIPADSYDVSYKDNVNVGTATATVVAKGNYTGTIEKTFMIEPIVITKIEVGNVTYNGKEQKPKVTAYDAKGNVIPASDYKATYKNNKNVGVATVVVVAKGNHAGQISKNFTVLPANTSITKLTSAKKAFTVKWSKKSSQVTGYQVQYSTSKKFSGAKTITVKSYKTTSKKITKLKAKKTYYVKVRTYKTVNGKKYYSAWSKVKTVKTK